MLERTPFTQVSKKEALDAQVKADKELIFTAKVDLREMGPSLRDFISRIEAEKPEVVVFMDKGARIFAGPIARALKERAVHEPEILFFNDASAKKRFNDVPDFSKEEFRALSESEYPKLKILKDKKVFFFDEVYAYGLGAAIIEKLSSEQTKWSYFALSSYVGRKSFYPQDVEKEIRLHSENMKKENRFIVYPHDRRNVFSSDAAKLYVDETNNKTTVPKKLKMADSETTTIPGTTMRIPNAYWSSDPDERALFSESQNSLRSEKLATVHTIKDMIYETLTKSD